MLETFLGIAIPVGFFSIIFGGIFGLDYLEALAMEDSFKQFALPLGLTVNRYHKPGEFSWCWYPEITGKYRCFDYRLLILFRGKSRTLEISMNFPDSKSNTDISITRKTYFLWRSKNTSLRNQYTNPTDIEFEEEFNIKSANPEDIPWIITRDLKVLLLMDSSLRKLSITGQRIEYVSNGYNLDKENLNYISEIMYRAGEKIAGIEGEGNILKEESKEPLLLPLICPSCGTEVYGNNKFCNNCGNKIR